MKFDRKELEEMGFVGFLEISHLKYEGCKQIPSEKGVYVVYRNIADRPNFLEKSIGGHFKGRDPTLPINELEKQWVDNANVLYIGQAGGRKSNSTLYKRLKAYFDFGKGKPISHWGGRLIWQLKNSDNLLLAWKVLPNSDPYDFETDLIGDFKTAYGKRPFANLVK